MSPIRVQTKSFTRVTNLPIQGNKIYFEFDPFELAGVDEPIEGGDQIREDLANLIREEVLAAVGNSRSPVAGESWKATLSPGYKKFKKKYSSVLRANMELHGDMLDAMECVVNGDGNLELRIIGKNEAAKADGHNNHSGESSLPQRRFIPDDGQTFKAGILSKMRAIIAGGSASADGGDEDVTTEEGD